MVPVLELTRLESTLHYGTFGTMRINKVCFCVTLEPPNFQNMRNFACIPAGQYQCSKITSPTYGVTFEVRHVPNRSNILFHPGNLVADTEGCILLGQYYGKLRGDRAVRNSGGTFRRFLSDLRDNDTLNLTVSEAY